MKYCPNCGTQIGEGVTFCPNCGSAISNAQTNEQANQNTGYSQPTPVNSSSNMNGRPTVQNRNIVTCILLSIVTCGIYGIIWYINLVNDVNTVCQDEKSNQSGGMVFLLTLITCGIYGIIFFYNAGKRLANAGSKHQVTIADNSTIYLILSIIGLQIIDYCMVQSDLNKFSA